MNRKEDYWRGRDLADWIQAFHTGDDDLRWEAVDAITMLASPAQSVPMLTAALADLVLKVRGRAAHGLYDIIVMDKEDRPYLMESLQPLVECLTDDDPWLACETASILRLMGPLARKFTPALREMARSGDKERRKAACRALRRIRGFQPKPPNQ
jgi:HEAT repeat protein